MSSSPCANCGADLRVCIECDWHNGEWISKDQYEAELKADLAAVLTELKTEINIMSDTVVEDRTVTITSWSGMKKRICKLIQSKIDKLKEVKDASN